jgi:pimeloyl-ACP methyl ester carboxylesterase
MAKTATQTGYAPVNGLQMYYEIHGAGEGAPLVLLHGAFSAIGTSFGKMLPGLAETRRVIGVELQAHGHTADVDRPLTLEQMADDTAALLRYLKVERADLFGYSLGAAVALQLAVRHPELLRKQVLASISYNSEGFHPGLLAGMEGMRPEQMVGTPWYDEYQQIAPHPEQFPTLFAKKSQLDKTIKDVSPATIKAITAPTMLVAGDSDIIRPEHTVELFRLLGGGVAGDVTGLPNARLAVLPGTTHVSVVDRAEVLVPMIQAFLDAPLPGAGGAGAADAHPMAEGARWRWPIAPARSTGTAEIRVTGPAGATRTGRGDGPAAAVRALGRQYTAEPLPDDEARSTSTPAGIAARCADRTAASLDDPTVAAVAMEGASSLLPGRTARPAGRGAPDGVAPTVPQQRRDRWQVHGRGRWRGPGGVAYRHQRWRGSGGSASGWWPAGRCWSPCW